MPTSGCCHHHVFGRRESDRGAHRSASCDSYRSRLARTAAEDGVSWPPNWRRGTGRGASRTAGRSWTPSAWPPATTATTSSRCFEGDGGWRCVDGWRGPALRPGVPEGPAGGLGGLGLRLHRGEPDPEAAHRPPPRRRACPPGSPHEGRIRLSPPPSVRFLPQGTIPRT